MPDEAHEALRDLTRTREDVRFDLVRARHRLTKFLLRLGLVPPAGVKAWTRRHRQWPESLGMPYPSQQTVLREYLIAIVQAEDRIQRLDQEIADAANTSPHAALIAALQTLRGIALIHAVTLVAELGDLSRFRTPRQLMAYVGLVPREASTGNRAHRGPITKTGNAHVRYTIVEAAWHYRHPPGGGANCGTVSKDNLRRLQPSLGGPRSVSIDAIDVSWIGGRPRRTRLSR